MGSDCSRILAIPVKYSVYDFHMALQRLFQWKDYHLHMVERQKKQYGWEFLFLGANIDAVEVAGRFGIGKDRAINYECDSVGTQLNYQVLSETVSAVRKAKSAAEMDEAIMCSSAPIRKDYERRHRRGRR